jgi:hypothetical protein
MEKLRQGPMLHLGVKGLDDEEKATNTFNQLASYTTIVVV